MADRSTPGSTEDSLSNALTLSRLIMVRTSMWRIPEIERARRSGSPRLPQPEERAGGGGSTRHAELLNALLGNGSAGIDGDAWLGEVTESGVDYQPAGGDGCREVAEKLRIGVLGEAGRIVSGEAGVMSGWHHRVFLGPGRLRTLSREDDPRLSLYAIVDISFVDLLHRPMCQVHLSVWSAMPVSARHTPRALLEAARPADTSPHRVPPDRFASIKAQMERVSAALYGLVAAHMLPVRFQIFEWVYDLPVFWVAVPAQLKSDPSWYTNGRQRVADLLAAHLLGVGSARDSGVASSVLNGDFLVLRRVVVGSGGRGLLPAYRPQYVAVPSRRTYPRPGTHDNGRHDYSGAVNAQEESAAALVTRLATLEAHSGSQLYDVERDLEVWKNHLGTYTAVAERGAFLWDALATHLPMRRGKALTDAHRAVQLLHQMLLQGVADLGHLRALIRDCATRVDRACEVLKDEYDRAFSELDAMTSPGGQTAEAGRIGLRSAITETGLFERVQRQVQLLMDEGSWVRARYDELTGAITAAFDERRVRELDVLQKAGVILSVTLGLVGLVNVLDTVNTAARDNTARHTATRSAGWVGALGDAHRRVIGLSSRYLLTPLASHTRDTALLSLILAALAIVAALWVSHRVRRSRVLSSARFRTLYDGLRGRRVIGRNRLGVWHFLKDASTDSLEDLRTTFHDRGDWERLDTDLATRFADLWDSASAHDAERRDAYQKDIKALSVRIEQWGIHGLLVTERPRQLHEYVLPRLICLYRHCMSWPGSFLDKVGEHRPGSLVHDGEFVRAMQWLGLVRSQALEFDRHIAEWLDRNDHVSRPAAAANRAARGESGRARRHPADGHRPNGHARAVLQLLDRLRFDATLTPQGAEELLLRAEEAARGGLKADGQWSTVPANDGWDTHVVDSSEVDEGSLDLTRLTDRAAQMLANRFDAANPVAVALPEDPAPLVRPGPDPVRILDIRYPQVVAPLPQVEPGAAVKLHFQVRPTNLRVFQVQWTVQGPDPAQPIGRMTGVGLLIDPSTGFIERDPRARLKDLTA